MIFLKNVFAVKLKELRNALGLTQQQLAAALCVTPQSVSRWENGVVYPDMEMLPEIADYFSVSLDELMGHEKKPDLEELFHKERIKLDMTGDIEVRRKMCDILAKLSEKGSHEIEYFNEVMLLAKKGRANASEIEIARERARKKMSDFSGGALLRNLSRIVSSESDDMLDSWMGYVTNESFSTWRDIMLMRYRNLRDVENFTKQRQEILYEEIWKIVEMYANDIPDYSESTGPGSIRFGKVGRYCDLRSAFDILSVYSKEVGDIFLTLRIFIEFKLALACFAEKLDTEGFMHLDSVARNIQYLCSLPGKCVLYGSVPVFDNISEDIIPEDRCNAFSYIVLAINRVELQRIRDDIRITEFFKLIGTLVKENGLYGIYPESDRDDFAKLYRLAKELAAAAGKGGQAVVLMSSNGNIYKTTVEADGDFSCDSLISELRSCRDTLIEKVVCVWHDTDGVDLTSCDFRIKLISLNDANKKARIIVNGLSAFYSMSIESTMPPDWNK